MGNLGKGTNVYMQKVYYWMIVNFKCQTAHSYCHWYNTERWITIAVMVLLNVMNLFLYSQQEHQGQS